MNLKLKRVYILGFIIATILLFPSAMKAEEVNIPANQLFEASLMSLRESYKKLQEENNFLNSDIESYHQKIGSLEQEIKNFDQMKLNKRNNLPQLSPDLDQQDQQMLQHIKEVQQLQHEVLQLQSQYSGFNEKMNLIERYGQRMEKEQSLIKDETQTYQEKIKKYQNQIDELSHGQDGRDLMAELEHYKKSNNTLEGNLKALKGAHNKPTIEIQKLKQEKISLEQSLSVLEDGLRLATEQEKQILQEIENINHRKEDELSRLDDSLAKFKSKEKELEEVLAKAHQKLNPDGSLNEGDAINLDHLQQNVSVIKEENLTLKKDLADLKQRLERSSSP